MDKIEQILQADMDDGVILGGSVLAAKDGSVYYECGIGFTSPERKFAMDADTVLDVASTTKVAAVITALLICHHRGLVDFDAPFTKYLKEFAAPLYETVTVRDLANHHSGFGDVIGDTKRRYFDESGTQMIRNLLTTPPPHPLTLHAHYACWNYLLLGLLLEAVTGESLAAFCQREIFKPLNMNSTSLGRPLEYIPLERLGQTMGTARPGEISDFVAMRIYRDGGNAGNAGLFTSAHDFGRLLQCHLDGGLTPSGKRLFSEAEVAEIAPDRAQSYHGYRRFGWSICENYLPDEMFGSVLFHSGWSGQTILFDLSRNMYACVLTTRCGDYERAKSDRFEILHQLWRKVG